MDSALLVTNESLRKLGVTASLEQAMENAGIRCVIFDKTPANPSIDSVEAAFAMYQSGKCGAVIGFGGGSCIDCAKTVAARATHPKRTVRQMAGNMKLWRKLVPLFAVPTTAGTGSEATVAAVLVDSENHRKFRVITTKCGLANGMGERLGDRRNGGIWLRSGCQHSENRRPSELPA